MHLAMHHQKALINKERRETHKKLPYLNIVLYKKEQKISLKSKILSIKKVLTSHDKPSKPPHTHSTFIY